MCDYYVWQINTKKSKEVTYFENNVWFKQSARTTTNKQKKSIQQMCMVIKNPFTCMQYAANITS